MQELRAFLKKLRVLLVDDEEEFITTLAERLSMRGVQTLVVLDGKEAFSAVEAHTPHMVVLDMMMPSIRGADILARIKASHPHVHVLMLSGHSNAADREEVMTLGAFDYLTKPLHFDELLQKLYEAGQANLANQPHEAKAVA